MTDWPKMESKVTISDAYFVSEDFKDLTEDAQRELLGLSELPLKVVSLSIFLGRHLVGVTDGTVDYSVPLEYIESMDVPWNYAATTTDEVEKAHAESIPGGKTVLTEEEFKKRCPNGLISANDTTNAVSFRFTNYSFLDDAILFFARNGYKAWVEEEPYILTRTGRLMVEKPKESR